MLGGGGDGGGAGGLEKVGPGLIFAPSRTDERGGVGGRGRGGEGRVLMSLTPDGLEILRAQSR